MIKSTNLFWKLCNFSVIGFDFIIGNKKLHRTYTIFHEIYGLHTAGEVANLALKRVCVSREVISGALL